MEITKLILDWAGEHYVLTFFAIMAVGSLGRIGSTRVEVKVNRKKEGA